MLRPKSGPRVSAHGRPPLYGGAGSLPDWSWAQSTKTKLVLGAPALLWME